MNQNVAILIFLCCVSNIDFSHGKQQVSIGVLFDKPQAQAEIPLNSTIFSGYRTYKKRNTDFSANIYRVSNIDTFETGKIVCNAINSQNGVAAIFGATTSIATPLAESICKYFNIPYIITSWRETFNQRSDVLLNFHPDADLFSAALAKTVTSLDWQGFYIIYETEEGLLRLQEVLKLQDFGNNNLITVRQLESGGDQRTLLKNIRNVTSRIILECSRENIIPILQQAKEVKMLNDHFSYFLTSLDAYSVDYSVLDTKVNITVLRLFDHGTITVRNTFREWELSQYEMFGRRLYVREPVVETETVLFADALNFFSHAVEDLAIENDITTEPLDCDAERKFEMGKMIVDRIKMINNLDTLTGPIKFDENGNRIDFNLHLFEVRSQRQLAIWFQGNNSLLLTRSAEETSSAALSTLHDTIVRVSTKLGEPFLMEVKPKEGEVLIGNARYKGFTKDLMDGIANVLNITYEFFLTADGNYGSYDESKKAWNGLIGDIIRKEAHLAICDLTATHERQRVVDFSTSFMTLGISILHKYVDKSQGKTFAFLDPFESTVWIYTATLYLGVSVILFFIARLNPGDWVNPHPCEENPKELENEWGFRNCHWVTLGAIMNQGCDILPKGISSRIAVSMWWFFALIITNSYMANLTAFLTKANLEPPIDSAEALASQHKIKYGLLRRGSTEAFFRESNVTVYQRMYEAMKATPTVLVATNKEGVNRVVGSPKALYAFIMESSIIEYEAETQCELKQIGGWLDVKNYAIAMPMNAPYRSSINQAILSLQQAGDIVRIKTKWWKEERNKTSCDKTKRTDDASLTLSEVAGIFLMLGVGIGVTCIWGFTEFLWNVRNISVEEHISFWEALKVEVKFACNIWITKKKIKPDISESSSSKSDKTDNRSIIQNFIHSASSFMNINQT